MTITAPVIPRYPDLYPKPLQAPHSGVIDAGISRSGQKGFPEQYRFMSTAPTRMSVSFLVPTADFDAWLTWVNTYGVTRWCLLPVVDQYRKLDPTPTYDWAVARFTGQFRTSPVGEANVDVQCDIDLLPEGIGVGKPGTAWPGAGPGTPAGEVGLPDPLPGPINPAFCVPHSCTALQDYWLNAPSVQYFYRMDVADLIFPATKNFPDNKGNAPNDLRSINGVMERALIDYYGGSCGTSDWWRGTQNAGLLVLKNSSDADGVGNRRLATYHFLVTARPHTLETGNLLTHTCSYTGDFTFAAGATFGIDTNGSLNMTVQTYQLSNQIRTDDVVGVAPSWPADTIPNDGDPHLLSLTFELPESYSVPALSAAPWLDIGVGIYIDGVEQSRPAVAIRSTRTNNSNDAEVASISPTWASGDAQNLGRTHPLFRIRELAIEERYYAAGETMPEIQAAYQRQFASYVIPPECSA